MALMVYPECKNKISTTAAACRKCGWILTAEAWKKQEQANRFPMLIPVVIGAVIRSLAILIILLAGCQESGKAPEPSSTKPPKVDVVGLGNSLGTHVPAAVSEETFDQMSIYLKVDDGEMIDRLMASDQMIAIPNGTWAVVLGQKHGIYDWVYVGVMRGDLAGRKVYVSPQFVVGMGDVEDE
jgi:hypothetical protein